LAGKEEPMGIESNPVIREMLDDLRREYPTLWPLVERWLEAPCCPAVLQTRSVDVSTGTALGVRIGNPQNPEKATIIVLIGKRGMIVCRNFDIAALEQRGVAAARVQGITSVEEALTAPIESCTAQATNNWA
jgi:uncharacterized protein YunC (DUF1805 family)